MCASQYSGSHTRTPSAIWTLTKYGGQPAGSNEFVVSTVPHSVEKAIVRGTDGNIRDSVTQFSKFLTRTVVCSSWAFRNKHRNGGGKGWERNERKGFWELNLQRMMTKALLIFAFTCSAERAFNYTATTHQLSYARRDLGGIAAGGLFYFGGGCNDTKNQFDCTSPSDSIEIFSADFTSKKTARLSEARGWPCACATADGDVVFAGGFLRVASDVPRMPC